MAEHERAADGSPLPGSPGSPLWDPGAVPAATVIVLRDGDEGPEVLMLKRDRDLRFAGGMWVFPGGRIDDEDWLPDEQDIATSSPPDPNRTEPNRTDPTRPDPNRADEPDRAIETAARRAAVREAMEEAGIAVIEPSLRRWSHWTPPQFSDHRFTTAFFVAPADDASAEIVVDDGEIREHRWATPADVVSLRDTGEIELAPPTFITLRQLMEHTDVSAVLEVATRREQTRTIEHFATRVVTHDGGWTAVYHGDTLYESAGAHGATSAGLTSAAGEVTALDLNAAGPRHRLLMAEQWSYIRQGC